VAEKLLPPQEIINRLQQGGLVVYLRHAATDRSQEDQHPVDLKQCATQRNLSTAGKKQSKNIGAAFKRLAIPVSEVFASPFCRCKDTAQLAFGDYRIDHNLYFAVALEKQQRDQQTKVLKDLLSDTPDSGNRVIVSHTGNLREATGLWPKPEGVAYIFEPNEIPTPHLVGIIKPDEWNNL
ncbi:histidine phosphatase family protein, partial [candidate division KSB1 bacterium]|nr:histidine phosphatase family protein [Gammaproteobacteria bacterium]NIU94222.1 histidine phosphatase family protein [candidate division KSB1 bacterium]NIV96838.1 histidine phosphatase family protein [candidate division KSB1 bacterium]NIW19718.1 histidine phosphatase family protein [candidate division KSB1 bacterium]NIW70193.1 histidine phosphatase family protein [candidate division KSB1 bacterium]